MSEDNPLRGFVIMWTEHEDPPPPAPGSPPSFGRRFVGQGHALEFADSAEDAKAQYLKKNPTHEVRVVRPEPAGSTKPRS